MKVFNLTLIVVLSVFLIAGVATASPPGQDPLKYYYTDIVDEDEEGGVTLKGGGGGGGTDLKGPSMGAAAAVTTQDLTVTTNQDYENTAKEQFIRTLLQNGRGPVNPEDIFVVDIQDIEGQIRVHLGYEGSADTFAEGRYDLVVTEMGVSVTGAVETIGNPLSRKEIASSDFDARGDAAAQRILNLNIDPYTNDQVVMGIQMVTNRQFDEEHNTLNQRIVAYGDETMTNVSSVQEIRAAGYTSQGVPRAQMIATYADEDPATLISAVLTENSAVDGLGNVHEKIVTHFAECFIEGDGGDIVYSGPIAHDIIRVSNFDEKGRSLEQDIITETYDEALGEFVFSKAQRIIVYEFDAAGNPSVYAVEDYAGADMGVLVARRETENREVDIFGNILDQAVNTYAVSDMGEVVFLERSIVRKEYADIVSAGRGMPSVTEVTLYDSPTEERMVERRINVVEQYDSMGNPLIEMDETYVMGNDGVMRLIERMETVSADYDNRGNATRKQVSLYGYDPNTGDIAFEVFYRQEMGYSPTGEMNVTLNYYESPAMEIETGGSEITINEIDANGNIVSYSVATFLTNRAGERVFIERKEITNRYDDTQSIQAVDIADKGTGWRISGDTIWNTASRDAWVEYTADFVEGFAYDVGMTATNNGSLTNYRNNVGEYAFLIRAYLDGEEYGIFEIPSTADGEAGYESGFIEMVGIPGGEHTIRLEWVNDFYQAGGDDANIQIKDVFASRGTTGLVYDGAVNLEGIIASAVRSFQNARAGLDDALDSVREYIDMLTRDNLDVNADGEINEADIELVNARHGQAVNYADFLSEDEVAALDVNGDGILDTSDVEFASTSIQQHVDGLNPATVKVLTHRADGTDEVRQYQREGSTLNLMAVQEIIPQGDNSAIIKTSYFSEETGAIEFVQAQAIDYDVFGRAIEVRTYSDSGMTELVDVRVIEYDIDGDPNTQRITTYIDLEKTEFIDVQQITNDYSGVEHNIEDIRIYVEDALTGETRFDALEETEYDFQGRVVRKTVYSDLEKTIPVEEKIFGYEIGEPQMTVDTYGWIDGEMQLLDRQVVRFDNFDPRIIREAELRIEQYREDIAIMQPEIDKMKDASEAYSDAYNVYYKFNPDMKEMFPVTSIWLPASWHFPKTDRVNVINALEVAISKNPVDIDAISEALQKEVLSVEEAIADLNTYTDTFLQGLEEVEEVILTVKAVETAESYLVEIMNSDGYEIVGVEGVSGGITNVVFALEGETRIRVSVDSAGRVSFYKDSTLEEAILFARRNIMEKSQLEWGDIHINSIVMNPSLLKIREPINFIDDPINIDFGIDRPTTDVYRPVDYYYPSPSSYRISARAGDYSMVFDNIHYTYDRYENPEYILYEKDIVSTDIFDIFSPTDIDLDRIIMDKYLIEPKASSKLISLVNDSTGVDLLASAMETLTETLNPDRYLLGDWGLSGDELVVGFILADGTGGEITVDGVSGNAFVQSKLGDLALSARNDVAERLGIEDMGSIHVNSLMVSDYQQITDVDPDGVEKSREEIRAFMTVRTDDFTIKMLHTAIVAGEGETRSELESLINNETGVDIFKQAVDYLQSTYNPDGYATVDWKVRANGDIKFSFILPEGSKVWVTLDPREGSITGSTYGDVFDAAIIDTREQMAGTFDMPLEEVHINGVKLIDVQHVFNADNEVERVVIKSQLEVRAGTYVLTFDNVETLIMDGDIVAEREVRNVLISAVDMETGIDIIAAGNLALDMMEAQTSAIAARQIEVAAEVSGINTEREAIEKDISVLMDKLGSIGVTDMPPMPPLPDFMPPPPTISVYELNEYINKLQVALTELDVQGIMDVLTAEDLGVDPQNPGATPESLAYLLQNMNLPLMWANIELRAAREYNKTLESIYQEAMLEKAKEALAMLEEQKSAIDAANKAGKEASAQIETIRADARMILDRLAEVGVAYKVLPPDQLIYEGRIIPTKPVSPEIIPTKPYDMSPGIVYDETYRSWSYKELAYIIPALQEAIDSGDITTIENLIGATDISLSDPGSVPSGLGALLDRAQGALDYYVNMLSQFEAYLVDIQNFSANILTAADYINEIYNPESLTFAEQSVRSDGTIKLVFNLTDGSRVWVTVSSDTGEVTGSLYGNDFDQAVLATREEASNRSGIPVEEIRINGVKLLDVRHVFNDDNEVERVEIKSEMVSEVGGVILTLNNTEVLIMDGDQVVSREVDNVLTALVDAATGTDLLAKAIDYAAKLYSLEEGAAVDWSMNEGQVTFAFTLEDGSPLEVNVDPSTGAITIVGEIDPMDKALEDAKAHYITLNTEIPDPDLIVGEVEELSVGVYNVFLTAAYETPEGNWVSSGAEYRVEDKVVRLMSISRRDELSEVLVEFSEYDQRGNVFKIEETTSMADGRIILRTIEPTNYDSRGMMGGYRETITSSTDEGVTVNNVSDIVYDARGDRVSYDVDTFRNNVRVYYAHIHSIQYDIQGRVVQYIADKTDAGGGAIRTVTSVVRNTKGHIVQERVINDASAATQWEGGSTDTRTSYEQIDAQGRPLSLSFTTTTWGSRTEDGQNLDGQSSGNSLIRYVDEGPIAFYMITTGINKDGQATRIDTTGYTDGKTETRGFFNGDNGTGSYGGYDGYYMTRTNAAGMKVSEHSWYGWNVEGTYTQSVYATATINSINIRKWELVDRNWEWNTGDDINGDGVQDAGEGHWDEVYEWVYSTISGTSVTVDKNVNLDWSAGGTSETETTWNDMGHQVREWDNDGGETDRYQETYDFGDIMQDLDHAVMEAVAGRVPSGWEYVGIGTRTDEVSAAPDASAVIDAAIQAAITASNGDASASINVVSPGPPIASNTIDAGQDVVDLAPSGAVLMFDRSQLEAIEYDRSIAEAGENYLKNSLGIEDAMATSQTVFDATGEAIVNYVFGEDSTVSLSIISPEESSGESVTDYDIAVTALDLAPMDSINVSGTIEIRDALTVGGPTLDYAGVPDYDDVTGAVIDLNASQPLLEGTVEGGGSLVLEEEGVLLGDVAGGVIEEPTSVYQNKGLLGTPEGDSLMTMQTEQAETTTEETAPIVDDVGLQREPQQDQQQVLPPQ